MTQRHFSLLDQAITQLDSGIRTLLGNVITTERENPANTQDEAELSATEKELAGRLMRINHAGEVAAQGLYQGQALTAKLPLTRQQMQRSASEENDHLAWCRQRIKELDTHTSVLDPIWYLGSLSIGAAAGLVGDKWSLGFVAETEHQVVKHLDEHLTRISKNDVKSRAILKQMKHDEAHHATVALEAGAHDLPTPIKKAMTLVSKIMTRSTYWI